VPSSSKLDAQQFNELFSEVAVARDFVWDYGGWFWESRECVIVLDLQESNFGNYHEPNITILYRYSVVPVS
jgi:hypothetical protein